MKQRQGKQLSINPSDMKPKRINIKPMSKKTIDVDVISVDVEIIDHKQRATIVVEYDGEESIEAEVLPEQKLTIEIPSHAPPPLKQKEGA